MAVVVDEDDAVVAGADGSPCGDVIRSVGAGAGVGISGALEAAAEGAPASTSCCASALDANAMSANAETKPIRSDREAIGRRFYHATPNQEAEITCVNKNVSASPVPRGLSELGQKGFDLGTHLGEDSAHSLGAVGRGGRGGRGGAGKDASNEGRDLSLRLFFRLFRVFGLGLFGRHT